MLDTFPEHLKTEAKSMCNTLKCKDRLFILPSHEIVIDGEIDQGSNIRDYIMDSLIEPPTPGTPKFTLLEKENKTLKRNSAYYEKALARARGVSRCRKFESIIDGTVDRCDFSDDTNSDESSDGDDDTDGTEDNAEDDVTDGTEEDEEIDMEEDDETSGDADYDAAARTTGIDRKQLRSWIQTAGKLNSVSKKRSAKRIPGGGRPAFFPEMEAELFSWFVDQRQKKMAVTYNRLRAYVQTIRQKFNLPPEFLVSSHWIQNFGKRVGISCRRITHHGQQDRRHPDVLQDNV